MTELLETIAARLAPSHTAVVVIDMQHDFCAEEGYVERVVGRSTLACREMVPRLNEFLEACRATGVPLVWVRAIYDHDKLPVGMLVKQRANGSDVCCAKGSAGAEFYGVTNNPEEPVFDKHSYSAFVGTGLGDWLRAEGIRSLIFTGVQTNVCVETSLRDAVCNGFYAAIARDCVASHSPPLHEATLANVGALFGDVVDATEITDMWKGTSA